MTIRNAAHNQIHVSPGGEAHFDGDSRIDRRPPRCAGIGIDIYGKRECAWRAGDKYTTLGNGRTLEVRLAHRRVSLLGSSSLLPIPAKRRLCDWRGVPQPERAMGCSIPQIA